MANIDEQIKPVPPYRAWVDDPVSFSTYRVGKLRHNFQEHPLLQLPRLAQFGKMRWPLGQCRFIRPGATQASALVLAQQTPDGRTIDELFRRIEEPGSWVALYNVETDPEYRALLAEVARSASPLIEREQPGIFLMTGFIFISAPPSVTPFHIDRENTFWLQIHGHKTMNVWDPTDRIVVPGDLVENFIVSQSLKKVRLKEEFRPRSHEFETGPGEGVYLPSTAPHMTRSNPDWARPGDGVAVSLSVNFYTSVTRRTARVHQTNAMLRKFLGLSPALPGNSRWDPLKAPVGRVLGAARYRLSRVTPPPGAY